VDLEQGTGGETKNARRLWRGSSQVVPDDPVAPSPGSAVPPSSLEDGSSPEASSECEASSVRETPGSGGFVPSPAVAQATIAKHAHAGSANRIAAPGTDGIHGRSERRAKSTKL
jgi:hypothetical protein